MKFGYKIFGVLCASLALCVVGNFATPKASAITGYGTCVDGVFSTSSSSLDKTCVKYIQILTNEVYAKNSKYLGSRTPLVVDGVFGAKTKSAIVNIQAHTGVSTISNPATTIWLTKDGVVGRQTWAVICVFGQLFTSNSNYYVMSASGCKKSNGYFRAFDYFSGLPMVYATH